VDRQPFEPLGPAIGEMTFHTNLIKAWLGATRSVHLRILGSLFAWIIFYIPWFCLL
jgi:hypothetical protein